MWGRIHTFGLFPSETVQFVRQAGKDFARGEGQNLIKKTPAGRGPAGEGLGLERGSSPSQGRGENRPRTLWRDDVTK
jgi:hypothetical protein